MKQYILSMDSLIAGITEIDEIHNHHNIIYYYYYLIFIIL